MTMQWAASHMKTVTLMRSATVGSVSTPADLEVTLAHPLPHASPWHMLPHACVQRVTLVCLYKGALSFILVDLIQNVKKVKHVLSGYVRTLVRQRHAVRDYSVGSQITVLRVFVLWDIQELLKWPASVQSVIQIRSVLQAMCARVGCARILAWSVGREHSVIQKII